MSRSEILTQCVEGVYERELVDCVPSALKTLSRPDLREPFISLFWLGQGVTRVGSLVFLFLCWPGMVPNRRQLSIVVIIFRQLCFPLSVVGSCLCVSTRLYSFTFRFVILFSVHSLNK